MNKILIPLLVTGALHMSIEAASAQEAYFIDGYHGGIFGHYPLWNTQFYVDKLAEHPEWRISLEIEPETWDSVKVLTPDAYRQFQSIASNPRIEFVNPTYAQPYTYNIEGESLIRQFEYGIKTLQRHFPDIRFHTYSAEEPCFTSCLPAILKGFGYRYASLKCPNTCWGGYMEGYGTGVINWIGPDGSSLATVPRYACEALEEHSTWQTTAWHNSDKYLNLCRKAGVKDPIGMCLQDAGWDGGPFLGSGTQMKKGSAYCTWKEYFEEVVKGPVTDNWQMLQEAVLTNLMWGSQVLQRLAQAVRTAEHNIIMAEKVDAMRFLSEGKSAEAALFDKAWRTLMLSQHHDCWIVPYNRMSPLHKATMADKNGDMLSWAEMVTDRWTPNTNQIAHDIIMQALEEDKGDKLTLQIVNTTAMPRTEIAQFILPQGVQPDHVRLTDHKGREVKAHFFEKEGQTVGEVPVIVPSFGYVTYMVGTCDKKRKKADDVCKSYHDGKGNFVIENDIYRMVLDPEKGGSIQSLTYKTEHDAELVDTSSMYRFNELRGFFYEENGFRSTAETPADIIVTEQTPYTVSVDIHGHIAGHPCCQTLTLKKGVERIEGSVRIDWNGNPGIGKFDERKKKYGNNSRGNNVRAFKNDRYKLLLMFPAALQGQQLYKNAPFDVCRSKLENTFFDSWDAHKHNIIVNWVDIKDEKGKMGLSLFSDHTTSYVHGTDFPLALNIQYSGKGLWGADYTIDGPTSVRYALVPHTGNWDEAGIWNRNDQWNEPLLVNLRKKDKTAETHSFIHMNKAGYELSSVHVRDNALYVRLFNAEGDDRPTKVSFGFPVSEVTVVDLNGTVEEILVTKKENTESCVTVSIPRFGIRTLHVIPERIY